VGLYQVLYLNRTADVAYKPLAPFKPYVPFRDASCGVSTFHLTPYDVLRVRPPSPRARNPLAKHAAGCAAHHLGLVTWAHVRVASARGRTRLAGRGFEGREACACCCLSAGHPARARRGLDRLEQRLVHVEPGGVRALRAGVTVGELLAVDGWDS
jgi:hypothetical protein